MEFNFCPKCGFKFDDEYNFCPKCGYAFGKTEQKPEPLFDFSEDTATYNDESAAGFDKQLKEREEEKKKLAAERAELENEKKKLEAEKKAQAKKLFDDDEYEKAYPLILEFAEKGDAEFQYMAGFCYIQGYGELTEKEALQWFEKAAKQGHFESQLYSATLYKSGYTTVDKYHTPENSVKRDIDKAIYWFQKAIENREIDSKNKKFAIGEIEKLKSEKRK